MNGNSKRPPLAVYTIIERRDNGRKHWVRIGAAFENRDGSFNVRLDALPLNGTVHIRELSASDSAYESGSAATSSTAPAMEAQS